MEAVYLLWHVHAFSDAEEDEKLIGVYRTDDDANAAIERLGDKPGFRDVPNGFQIERYELDKDHWTEGYVTV